MNARIKALAGVSLAMLLLSQPLVAPSLGARFPRLTKASAAAIAKRDALAATAITSGDTAKVTGCKAIGRGAFRCQVTVIPVKSRSRCHLTDVIRLVNGRANISYSNVGCTS